MTVGGVPICVCSACGHAVFPPRLLCPKCAGSQWREEAVDRGVVEEATEALFRAGSEPVTRRLASVRTDAGPIVIARLLDDARPGAAVSLALSDGAVSARPRRSG
jgi:uncharacterized OB-fold protein